MPNLPDSWYAEARRRWAGKAEWVTGEGRYALVEPCRVLTIHLFAYKRDALSALKLANTAGCGERCVGDHRLVKLDDNNPLP